MKTTISKLVDSFKSVFNQEAEASFLLPVVPVPASRPRVTKWGSYYGKNYTNWRKDAAKFLDDLTMEQELPDALHVIVECYCPKARTSKRDYPRGDVDNFVKAPLDSITKHTDLWGDDDQIVSLLVTKQYVDEDFGSKITVYVDE